MVIWFCKELLCVFFRVLLFQWVCFSWSSTAVWRFFIMVLRLDFVTYSFSYGMVCSPPTFYGFPNYENRLGATLWRSYRTLTCVWQAWHQDKFSFINRTCYFFQQSFDAPVVWIMLQSYPKLVFCMTVQAGKLDHRARDYSDSFALSGTQLRFSALRTVRIRRITWHLRTFTGDPLSKITVLLPGDGNDSLLIWCKRSWLVSRWNHIMHFWQHVANM